jgi:hypothetical protein
MAYLPVSYSFTSGRNSVDFPAPTQSTLPNQTNVSQHSSGRVSGNRVEVRIESVRLYLGSRNILRSDCSFKNYGNAEAGNLKIQCYFVINKKINGGSDVKSASSIKPGETISRTFSSNLTLSPKKYYMEISSDGKTAKVYTGPYKGTPLMYEVECRFKFGGK